MTDTNFEKSPILYRVVAYILDIYVTSFIGYIFFLLLINPGDLDGKEFQNFNVSTLFVIVIFGTVYFGKDLYHGISPGRWVMGIMVRDKEDMNRIPSPFKLIIRNIILILYPIEFIMLLITGGKARIGDLVSNTNVVRNPNRDTRFKRISVCLFSTVIMFSITGIFMMYTLTKTNAYIIAAQHIETNENIRDQIGDIKSFATLTSGGVNIENDFGNAGFSIRVYGEEGEAVVDIQLVKEPNSDWEVVEMEIQ